METDLDQFFQKIKENISEDFFKNLAIKCYEDDRKYPENFSNWYYSIKNFGNFAHADIIANQIFSFEETKILEKSEDLKNINLDEINKVLKPTLDKMDSNTLYNIKNGCFSNKFDFQTCLATKQNLAEQLWKINYQSSLFDTGGKTELVVRELIPIDSEHQLTIYNGMPLRTEVRVFYNMETKKIEYIVDYWDYEYCYKNLHSANDKLIFDVFHNKIAKDMDINYHQVELDKVISNIRSNISTLKFDDNLKGIWSIDFLYDHWLDKIYLIDMARGFMSAYYKFNKLSKETQDNIMKEEKSE